MIIIIIIIIIINHNNFSLDCYYNLWHSIILKMKLYLKVQRATKKRQEITKLQKYHKF